MAGGANLDAAVGTGGMASKLAAARIAREAGCATVIAAGLAGAPTAGPLDSLVEGAKATLVVAAGHSPHRYKAWIAGRLHLAGSLVVDDGAAARAPSRSQPLGGGVTAARGSSKRATRWRCWTGPGREIARGLVRHDAASVERLKGLRTDDPRFEDIRS